MNTIPTSAGWYWWRRTSNRVPHRGWEAVLVTAGGILPQRVMRAGLPGWYGLKTMTETGEWGERIPQPQEVSDE